MREALDAQYAASLANAVEKEKEKLPKPSLDKLQAALLDEVVGKDGLLAVSKKQIENLLASDLKSQLAELRMELERLKKDAPQKFPFAHSLKESSKTRDLPVLARGNQESPGEETPRIGERAVARGSCRGTTQGGLNRWPYATRHAGEDPGL